MRDKIKDLNYFDRVLTESKETISYFQGVLDSLDETDLQGINEMKSALAQEYRELTKLSYSMGNNINEVLGYFFKWIKYYKVNCGQCDGIYDAVDIMAIGVMFDKRKYEFIDDLGEIMEKIKSQDGLLLCLYDYLEGKTGDYKPSKIYKYFNELPGSNEKEKVLGEAIKKWYQQHKSAYWYGTHKTEDLYYGYWCFEVAALVKIFGVDDTTFKDHKYYPYDMLHNDL